MFGLGPIAAMLTLKPLARKYFQPVSGEKVVLGVDGALTWVRTPVNLRPNFVRSITGPACD